jgi:hypothetical protein
MHKVGQGLIIGIILGLTIGLTIGWQLENLVSPERIWVTGKLEYSPTGDPSASARDPAGYYITDRTRFYIEPIRSNLVGKSVKVKGDLKIICGPDNFPCYPFIRAKSIE